MAMRDHELLGVAAHEGQRGIDNAYRDLRRAFHPERAAPHGTPRYRQTNEAYDALSHPRRTRVRRADASSRRVLSLKHDFQGGDPPLEQVLNSIRRDFTGNLRKSG